MTPAEILAVVRTIEIRLPIEIAVSFIRRAGAHAFEYRASVRDRDSGEIVEVRRVDEISDQHLAGVFPTRVSLVDYVYYGALRMVTHELDEGFLVGGERVRDPHGNGIALHTPAATLEETSDP